MCVTDRQGTQPQALFPPQPLMHPVISNLFVSHMLSALLVFALSSHACLQMRSIGQLQGLVQHLIRLLYMHKCGWAVPLLPPKVRCGLAQQWRLRTLICVWEQQWHLEQQGLAQRLPVKELPGP